MRARVQCSVFRVQGAGQRGFTLLEVLVAVALLATAFTIIVTTFSTALDGWRRGRWAMDRLHHGDFVAEQFVQALRSAAYFGTKKDAYGFWLENHGDQDKVSWVKSGQAFLPPGHPLLNGLHRVMVEVDENEEGEPAIAVRAFPHLIEELDESDVDPWFLSSRVQGLNCRVYDAEDEDWSDEWEDTNSIPALVELTLFLKSVEPHGEPIEVVRIIEIPIASALTSGVYSVSTPRATDTNAAPTGAGAATNRAPAGAVAAP